MMNTRILFAALALAACPLSVQAQATSSAPASPGTVTLRYKFTPGQVHLFSLVSDVNATVFTGQSPNGMPMNTHTEATLRQTVKDVRASDGAATVVSQLEGISTTMNGNPLPLSDDQKAQAMKATTVLMTPTGKVLSVKAEALQPGGMPGMDFSKVAASGNYGLPDGPSKVGDQWNGDVAAAMAGMKMSLTSTLTSLDPASSAERMAAIAQKFTGTLNMDLSKTSPIPLNITGDLSGTGDEKFDATAGAVASEDTTIQGTVTTVIGDAATPAPGDSPKSIKTNVLIHTALKAITMISVPVGTTPAP